ncbi:MAG TPA: hypothetical protein PLZ21_13450 [Armatimonadota bacterium]|nr:hypothetical protein [Armatimonadota bacterium]HOP81565.1 hypothetical protein [Armatimonadota bacterium]
MTFLVSWILIAVFGITCYSLVFIWAVRAKQFTELDRQRYIALRSEDLLDFDASKHDMTRADRYIWLVLTFLALAFFTAAVYLSLRGA